MMFMTMPEGWHRVIAARGAEKRALLTDPDWRAAARAEWDRVERGLFPHRRLETVRALMPSNGLIAASAIGERLVVRAIAESGLALRRMIVPIVAELSGAGSLPRLWHL